MFDDRRPRGVELRRARRRAPAGDAVRLLDQRDADPFRPGGLRRCHEVGRLHAAGGSVTEHESTAGLVSGEQMNARRTMRSIDLDCHAQILPMSGSTEAAAPLE